MVARAKVETEHDKDRLIARLRHRIKVVDALILMLSSGDGALTRRGWEAAKAYMAEYGDSPDNAAIDAQLAPRSRPAAIQLQHRRRKTLHRLKTTQLNDVNFWDDSQLKPANNSPFYAAGLYPKLAEVFRQHGYALAVHGSVGTDFDLIAVPWVDEAGTPDGIIRELTQKFAFDQIPDQQKPAGKPHGRIAYKLHLSFGDCALDISFTPRTGKWAKVKQK